MYEVSREAAKYIQILISELNRSATGNGSGRNLQTKVKVADHNLSRRWAYPCSAEKQAWP